MTALLDQENRFKNYSRNRAPCGVDDTYPIQTPAELCVYSKKHPDPGSVGASF
jgi:hypothetical protein